MIGIYRGYTNARYNITEMVIMENFCLTQLKLNNYRKFDEITLNLNPRMNVVIGKNVSGKTTFLEVVNVMLGAYLAAYKRYVPSQYVRNIGESDVLQKSIRQTSPDMEIASAIPCTISCDMIWIKTLIINGLLRKREDALSLMEKIQCSLRY